MPKPPITLDLNHGAIRLLKQLLGMPGWCDNTADSYRAGQLLSDSPEFEIPKPPVDQVLKGTPAEQADQFEAAEKAALVWMRTPVVLPCTEKQRDTMKRCVDHFVKAKQLPNGEVTNRLMDQLGLAPED